MKEIVKDPLQKGKWIVMIVTNEPLHCFHSECRDLVNELILRCNLLTPRVSSFKLINSDVIGSLFESILRVKPFHAKQDEKHRYRNMICHLSEVLNTDVSHLSGTGMASKDPKQLFFLLEILSTVLDSQISPSITSSPSISSSDTDSCAKCPSCQPSRRQRDFSPESCCSCSCPSRPSSVSSCVCSDLEHSSDSCSCTCSYCCYPTTSSTSLAKDEKLFHDVIQRQREGRKGKKHPLVVRHRTGRTPVRVVKKPCPDVTKEPLEPPEDVKSLMAKFKLAKEDAFALELGYRLHEAFKLEEETKRIEEQIDRFYRMKRMPSGSRKAVHVLTPSKSTGMSRSGVRSTGASRTTPKKQVTLSKSPVRTFSPKSAAETKSVSKSEDLNNIIKRSTSLESFLGKFTSDSFPPETRKKLKIMENKHNLMMNNLREEMRNKESKSCLLLKEAIDSETRKSDLLRKEIERLNHLKERKMNEIDLLDQNAAIKEYRIERAKVHSMVQDYHREMVSKFKSIQSKQEQLIKDEIENRMREERIEMLRMKNLLKEKEAREYGERKKLLKAFDGMYQDRFDSVKDKLEQVERDTRVRKKQNNQLLDEIKKRLKNELKMS